MMSNVLPMPESSGKSVEENAAKAKEDQIQSRILTESPDFIRTKLQQHYYRDMYYRIKENGTAMKTVDTYALGMLAVNMALVDDAMDDVEANGFMMEVQGDRNILMKRNPALEVLDKAQQAVKFYLKEFNMTPNSRGKDFNVGGSDETGDGFDQL